MQQDLESPIGILVKTTLIDFPGLVACSFFLSGCNLRCPYCYNAELANGIIPTNAVSIHELFEHLEKRKNVLKGLVLTGGEALLSPFLSKIIIKAKSLNYKIKLDTNGTLPEKLLEIIKNPETKPDFIAMDIKTSPLKYQELVFSQKEKVKINFTEKLLKSIKIISEYPTEKREFRTVLVPSLVTKKDIEEISKLLPKDANWQFATFLNENCLNKKFNDILPYSEKETNELIEIAKKQILGAKLR